MGGEAPRLTALLDTNVLIRHFTGEPRGQAERAAELLSGGETLVLTDLIVAETAYVLGSVYKLGRELVADLLRVVIAHPTIEVSDAAILLRTLALFANGHEFADAYLIARAEASCGRVASFDRGIDRVATVTRVE